jgi:hypothetical protein
MSSFSVKEACWNQRLAIAALGDRIRFFATAVNDPISLSLYQYAQLLASVLEFRPSFILELGRGAGNSTCLFTEAAHHLSLGPHSVLSIDQNDEWRRGAVPRLKKRLPESWFSALDAVQHDILAFDFKAALDRAERIVVFWDAHGFDVAECVLGAVLPEIAAKPHLVLMHDISDTRYGGPDVMNYGGNGIWKGTDFGGPRLKLGHIDSAVEQAISLIDFATRNGMPVHSADHDLHGFDAAAIAELRELQGDLFSLSAHWCHFALSEARNPLTFPAFRPCDNRVSQ